MTFPLDILRRTRLAFGMWTRPALRLSGLALVLGWACPGPAAAAPAGHGAATLTRLPAALPTFARPDLFVRGEAAPGSVVLDAGFASLVRTMNFHARDLRPIGSPDLSEQLIERMQCEAVRYEIVHLFDASGASAPIDSVAEDLRSQEAQRIFTRAFNRTLDGQLDTLARSSRGLAEVLDWLQDFGTSRSTSRTAEGLAIDRNGGVGAGGDRRETGRFRGTLGLNLGAHPRLVLGAVFGSLRARAEIPTPGEPLRLSVERSFGARSRAVLTSGLERDGRNWAALSLNIRF